MTGLAEATVRHGGDVEQARELADEALAIFAEEDDPVAHFDGLTVRAIVASWQGSEDDFLRFMERAYVIALDAKRKDLQTLAAQSLAQLHIIRLELDEADLLLTRALELAGESGSVRARVHTTLSYGWFLTMKGELDAAETVLEEVRTTAAELGIEPSVAAALMKLGCISRIRGDHKLAEKRLREAMRMVSARGDRGMLPDYQAVLAATLADLGKIDEAERLALESRSNASPDDTACRVAATTALGGRPCGAGPRRGGRGAVRRSPLAHRWWRSRGLGNRAARAADELPPRPRARRGRRALRGAARGSLAATADEHGANRLTRLLVGRLRDDRCRPLHAVERLA